MVEVKTLSWCGSDDEQIFGGEYSSKEDALARYPIDAEMADGETFFVGIQEPFDLTSLSTGHAEAILEKIEERVYEEIGDIDYFASNKKNMDELDAALAVVITKWLKKYNEPEAFRVVNVTTHIYKKV